RCFFGEHLLHKGDFEFRTSQIVPWTMTANQSKPSVVVYGNDDLENHVRKVIGHLCV
ncbi:4024_t:CDS:2, partial [Gigaspora rosea]